MANNPEHRITIPLSLELYGEFCYLKEQLGMNTSEAIRLLIACIASDFQFNDGRGLAKLISEKKGA
jgi:hypothetical protein